MENGEVVKAIVGLFLTTSGLSIAKKFIEQHDVKPLPEGAPTLEVLLKKTWIPSLLIKSANNYYYY